jgi:hypothetical protein
MYIHKLNLSREVRFNNFNIYDKTTRWKKTPRVSIH